MADDLWLSRARSIGKEPELIGARELARDAVECGYTLMHVRMVARESFRLAARVLRAWEEQQASNGSEPHGEPPAGPRELPL